MLILKIGGGRGINLEGVADDLAVYEGPVVIVHGANAWRDELAQKLGLRIETVTSVRGYDSVLSDDTALDLLMMAYAGLRNKQVVETLQRRRIAAVGLTGLDGRMIQGKRNPGIQCRQGEKIVIRRDRSGKPQEVNTKLLSLLTTNGYVPVLTVPICDEEGIAINADNDDIVTALHRALHATIVVSLLEAPGFLRDPHDPSSVIARMTQSDVHQWEERTSGRIKRKLHAINRLLQAHPTKVVLADGRGANPLRAALAGEGTVIQ